MSALTTPEGSGTEEDGTGREGTLSSPQSDSHPGSRGTTRNSPHSRWLRLCHEGAFLKRTPTRQSAKNSSRLQARRRRTRTYPGDWQTTQGCCLWTQLTLPLFLVFMISCFFLMISLCSLHSPLHLHPAPISFPSPTPPAPVHTSRSHITCPKRPLQEPRGPQFTISRDDLCAKGSEGACSQTSRTVWYRLHGKKMERRIFS